MVLLGREKIGVAKWHTIAILDCSTDCTCLSAPVFQPGSLGCPIGGFAFLVPGWFKMVCHHENQMTKPTVIGQTTEPRVNGPEGITREPRYGPTNFSKES